MVQPFWKAVWRFPRKVGIEPPFDPVIPLLSIYPKDLKSAYYSDMATPMFTAAQFTIDKNIRKKCSTSLAIREMQFHLILVRRAIIKNTSNNKCWQGCGGTGTLTRCW